VALYVKRLAEGGPYLAFFGPEPEPEPASKPTSKPKPAPPPKGRR
jgi:hypothetical protein